MTMEQSIRRRGRPQGSYQMDAATPEPQAAQEAAAPTKRRRRASVGGHAMKLTAPPREGYQRRWVNDTNDRLAMMDELGYDHVSDASIKSTDAGSRVSRVVGTKPNGEPLRAYLMETPVELYAEGVAEKEAQIRERFEAATTVSGVPEDQRTGAVTLRQD